MGEVKQLLKPLENYQLRDLFRELGLSDATLMNKYEHGTLMAYAEDLIRGWILERDNVLESEEYPGGATWENLKKSLKHCGHNGIAKKITGLEITLNKPIIN